MKGMIFTEFMEMVEETFSPDMVDTIIEASDLASDGAYTAVGTYDSAEMVQLVGHLSRESDIAVPDLLQAFGRYLFGRFSVLYPEMVSNINSTVDFLQNIEGYIHVEVKKLYPDAELPVFEHEQRGQNFELIYQSSRPFGDLAAGLIAGCVEHYGEPLIVQRQDLPGAPGTHVRFSVLRNDAAQVG